MTQSEVIGKITDLRDKAINDCAIAGMRSNSGCIKYYHHGKRVGFEDVLTICKSDDIYPDWIPFTEREPEDDCVVIVTLISGTVTVACYIDNDFHTMGDQVVAWMPLPRRYKYEKVQ